MMNACVEEVDAISNQSGEVVLGPAGEWGALIKDLVASWVGAVPEVGTYSSPSLSLGSGSFAVFLHHASVYLGEPRLQELAVEHLGYGVELINRSDPTASLYRSIPGLAWSMSHVLGRNSDVDAFMVEAQCHLVQALDEAPENLSIDLINGLAGLMVFATKSIAHTGDMAMIHAISRRYTRRFAHWEDGKNEFPAGAPDGNLGMAHGLPGILAVFARASNQGLLPQDAALLTSAGFSYLDRFFIETKDGQCYLPNEQAAVNPARLAWCYGGLGAAFACMQGRSIFAAAEQRSEQLLRYAADQFFTADARLNDATLCHGYAGSALQFSLVAGDDRLPGDLRASARSIVRESVRKVFELSTVSQGIRSFPARFTSGDRVSMSLLEGSMGVCLSLMAVHSEDRPEWLSVMGL